MEFSILAQTIFDSSQHFKKKLVLIPNLALLVMVFSLGQLKLIENT